MIFINIFFKEKKFLMSKLSILNSTNTRVLVSTVYLVHYFLPILLILCKTICVFILFFLYFDTNRTFFLLFSYIWIKSFDCKTFFDILATICTLVFPPLHIVTIDLHRENYLYIRSICNFVHRKFHILEPSLDQLRTFTIY